MGFSDSSLMFEAPPSYNHFSDNQSKKNLRSTRMISISMPHHISDFINSAGNTPQIVRCLSSSQTACSTTDIPHTSSIENICDKQSKSNRMHSVTWKGTGGLCGQLTTHSCSYTGTSMNDYDVDHKPSMNTLITTGKVEPQTPPPINCIFNDSVVEFTVPSETITKN
uniref:Uncharacterized protein n=1 Tax=Heterorhabditis bacteriophora TaxID=37862 RepID=A0A1I7X448_HETBA